MKKFFAIIVLALFSLTAFAGVPITGGPFTNPAINTIVVDSGAVTDNNHDLSFIVATTVACVLVLEHRDAANATNVWSQFIVLPANNTVSINIMRWTVLNNGERIRLRLNAAVTGSMQGSIIID